jgi:hypothetical protein
MTFPHKVLHITVSPDGEITCWDNRDRALLGKRKGDTHVELVLTLKQTQQIKDAAKEAKKPNGKKR